MEKKIVAFDLNKFESPSAKFALCQVCCIFTIFCYLPLEKDMGLELH